MTPERRTTARGKATSRVTFTDAASDTPSEGALRDIGRGGMFVATDAKLAVGKRIEFEVHVTPTPVAGMGRVIWVREAASGDLPAGLGIKFIDVDNDALVAIDRLVGLKTNVRERTVLGMAAPVPPPRVEPAPVIKPRERTMLGVAPPTGPARDKELSWPDEPPPPPPEPAPPPEEKKAEREAEPEPIQEPQPKQPEPAAPKPVESAPVVVEAKEVELPKKAAPKAAEPPTPRELPKREEKKGSAWIILLLLVVAGGVAGYVYRDRIMSVISPPAPTPTPTPTVSSVAPPVSVTASAEPSTSVSAAPMVATLDASAEELPDASTTLVAGDAGTHDAGHDGGKHNHDGGAGPHVHPHVHPTATATGNDSPYCIRSPSDEPASGVGKYAGVAQW